MNLDIAKYHADTFNQVKKWCSFLRAIRTYLHDQGYSEVTTSSLVQTGAFESTIDALTAKGQNQEWQLHTSPEMEMKKLLTKAKTDIFQITKCYRDDPDTSQHGKEFSMLEFYKIGAGYSEIIEETKNLIQSLNPPKLIFKEFSIEEIFLETINIKLSLLTTKEALLTELKKQNFLSASHDDSWEDLFFKLMLEKIEPSLNTQTVYILKDYPSSTSVLSKKIDGTIYSERFEVYWQGMELCNGCTENTNHQELLQNFHEENKKRILDNKSPHPNPHTFLEATKELPDCSGVAIGLDRLFMCML